MSRRSSAQKRVPIPDPKYGDVLVARLVNVIMRQGKKSIAEGVVYGAFGRIQEKTGRDGREVFEEAMENLRPAVEVQSRRVGGASYQVPIEVRSDRRSALALRWLVQYAQGRAGKSMSEKLSQELMDAAAKTGGAFKKREDTHRMAEANRAFAHFRF
ncbi:MAG: 30S ribosomal protein S7 [Nitrospirota bacterium]|nr:30S ribosomal protein S7 [Nitrospirota bacterium]